MTLILVEGFDHFNTLALLNDKLNTTNTSVDVNNSVTPASRGNSILLNAASDRAVFQPPNSAGILSGIVSFHMRTDNITQATNEWFISLVDSSFTVIQMQLRIREHGKLFIYKGDGTTNLGGTAAGKKRFLNNTWYFIEWQFYLANSIPANSNIVRVDGVEWGNLDATTDTSNGGNNDFGRFNFAGTAGLRYFDDIYFNTLTGVNNKTFLGPCYVQTLFPTGDAAATFVGQDGDSLDNYLNVDDTTPDEDTTHNRSDASNARDRYHFGDLVGTFSSVFGIDVVSRAKTNQVSPTVKWRNFAHVSGNTYDQTLKNLTSSYKFYQDIVELNPETSGPWSVDSVNQSQWGVQYNGV